MLVSSASCGLQGTPRATSQEDPPIHPGSHETCWAHRAINNGLLPQDIAPKLRTSGKEAGHPAVLISPASFGLHFTGEC
jgi:hypothetical protein